MPPPVVFPELYYPEEPGCGMRRRSQGELESDAVLFVSKDNPGAASVARELQQAAPTKLRLVHSSDAGGKQLQECTHFLLVLNRRTFVTDTDPDRPGERLAKQLREAFRINSHLSAWNYRFAVGTAIKHKKHGTGKVVELMVDGRTRVLFDSGAEHRYKPSSMHKLSLAEGSPSARLKALHRCAWSATILVHGSMSKLWADSGDGSRGEGSSERRFFGRSASASGDVRGVRAAARAADIGRGKEQGERSRARRPSLGIIDTRPVTLSRFGANMKLVVVHAINDAEDGCEFEHFFSTAPPDLVQAGIFSTIASPLFFYSPDFRKVSVSLILESFARKSSGINSRGRKMMTHSDTITLIRGSLGSLQGLHTSP